MNETVSMIIGGLFGLATYLFVLRPVFRALRRRFGHCECSENYRKNGPCTCVCFGAKDCVIREKGKILGREIAKRIIDESMEA